MNDRSQFSGWSEAGSTSKGSWNLTIDRYSITKVSKTLGNRRSISGAYEIICNMLISDQNGTRGTGLHVLRLSCILEQYQDADNDCSNCAGYFERSSDRLNYDSLLHGEQLGSSERSYSRRYRQLVPREVLDGAGICEADGGCFESSLERASDPRRNRKLRKHPRISLGRRMD